MYRNGQQVSWGFECGTCRTALCQRAHVCAACCGNKPFQKCSQTECSPHLMFERELSRLQCLQVKKSFDNATGSSESDRTKRQVIRSSSIPTMRLYCQVRVLWLRSPPILKKVVHELRSDLLPLLEWIRCDQSFSISRYRTVVIVVIMDMVTFNKVFLVGLFLIRRLVLLFAFLSWSERQEIWPGGTCAQTESR